MPFLIAALVVIISCIVITYRTLASYTHLPVWAKTAILFFLTLAWFSPFIVRGLKNLSWVNASAYAVLAKSAYFFMGLAFILFAFLLIRDIIWFVLYYISHQENFNPSNPALLSKANLIVLLLALSASLYGVYEANKTPQIKKIEITDPKIKQDTKIVVASDFHIDLSTPLWQINHIVDQINSLEPDYILLVGDIIDDTPVALGHKIDELKKLKAKQIFVTLGNHEYYNAPIQWLIEFSKIGFKVLQNSGTQIGQSGIYIAGIPDAHSADVSLARALQNASDQDYKILMSHAPKTIQDINEGQINLQVSGHTHGGQIFPFHFLVKEANGYLYGMHEVNGNKLYITRGAGYWGPPMRLLAPSDITLIHLKGQTHE